jgi:hypothetical protein
LDLKIFHAQFKTSYTHLSTTKIKLRLENPGNLFTAGKHLAPSGAESSIWQGAAAKLLSGEDLVGGSRPLVAASE